MLKSIRANVDEKTRHAIFVGLAFLVLLFGDVLIFGFKGPTVWFLVAVITGIGSAFYLVYSALGAPELNAFTRICRFVVACLFITMVLVLCDRASLQGVCP